MAAGDGGGVSENADDCLKDAYPIEVLQMIKSAQQQHGLRHGDFQRYRQYCTRRLRRIRKSLHFMQGTKHKVQPKKVTEETIAKDARYLYLPLFDAERCWSYAMQLKAESNTEPRKRFHMMSRLKKAISHSDKLAQLCESNKCDARTKLESQAYAAWMKGSLCFEQENWKTAMDCFKSAKTIYEKLASAFVDEVKEIYLQRVEELSPNIRYCAYNIGDETAVNDLRQMRMKTGGREDALSSRLDELIEKTREKQSATLSEVTWRGRTVPVKNEKVRLFLLSVQDMENHLAESSSTSAKVSMYETILKELIEAQQSFRDDMKDDPVFKARIRGQRPQGDEDDKIPNTVFLYTYLLYLKQTKTIDRNLLMIDSLKSKLSGQSELKRAKPQDVARLFDIICQNVLELAGLPGLEDDADLQQDIQAQEVFYKAFRCYYIAETYAAAKKYKEAIALYEQVLTYIKEAIQNYNSLKSSKQCNEKISELEKLRNVVDGSKYSVHASSILDIEEVNSQVSSLSVKNKVPLCDRMQKYAEDVGLTSKKPNLVHFPPEFEAVPAKPLFFDLAQGHLEFPSLDDKLEQKKQAGGISGFVKGWLSWGGGKK